MQVLSEANANTILNNDFTGDKIPFCRIVVGSNILTRSATFSINREYGVLAQQATVEIPNVNPFDPMDTGYYNAQRNHSSHNKPSNAYNGLIEPGAEIYIQAGYGSITNCVVIFTGNIDTVKVRISGNGDASLIIIARGKSGKLVDRTVKKYNTSTLITNYFMTYPVETNIQTFYLTSADTNPYLYEIWKDVAMRSGFATGDVDYNTYDGSNCTLRLNDINAESFIDMQGKWIDIAKKIVDLMYYTAGGTTYNFFHYEDENGKLYLAMDNNFSFEGLDNLTLNGETWVTLTDSATWNYRAIKESIVADSGLYTIDVDFEYDIAKNAIRRLASGSIPDGNTVSFVYTFCAWTFSPENNHLYDLEQWVSHDEIPGRLVVYNEESNIARYLDVGTLGDGTSVSTDKAEKTILTEYNTSTLLDNYLNQRKLEAKKNYFNMMCNVVGIPHLRPRDTVCFLLWGTATAIYKIMGYTLNYNSEYGFDMTLIGRFYENSDVS